MGYNALGQLGDSSFDDSSNPTEVSFTTILLSRINAGYYHVFSNTIDGPMFGPTGPIPGSSVSTTMTENSFLMSFSIGTRGEIF